MTEVIDCFVVGHWAVSDKKLTDRHVSRNTTNFIEVEKESVQGHPKELYSNLVATFSKEGDLVLDIGSGNGKLIFCHGQVLTLIKLVVISYGNLLIKQTVRKHLSEGTVFNVQLEHQQATTTLPDSY